MIFSHNIPVEPEKCLCIQGIEGYETYKIDANTIGLRPAWIDINIKKPPNGVYVLVALYDARPKVEMHFIQIAERYNDDWFDGHNGDSILGKARCVTHWMPLPDKPQNKNEKET